MVNRIFWIVEWFFSKPLKPWNYRERMKTLEYIWQECKGINTYIFCPKDDIYVTKKPYIIYTQKKIEEFTSYINICKKNKIQFIYWLNPTLWEKELLEKEKTIKKILNRFKQLQRIWCNNFCLLFDDIPIAYDVFYNTKKIDEKILQNIVDIVNTVYDWVKRDCKNFLFCSPDYCFKDKTSFTDILWNLNPDIYIFWTWKNIFTKNISSYDLKKTSKILWNKKIAIWKNYPVNDLQQNIWMYNLWWYSVFDSEINNNIPIFINPMREFGASFAFFKTFSEYIQNPKAYNPNKKIIKTRADILKISISTAKILQSFGQFDIYDTKNKIKKNISFILNNQTISELKDISIDNKWRKSIKVIIEQIQYMFDIKNSVNRGEKCNKIIERMDIFPTTSNNPRYFIEIYTIIQKRAEIGYYSQEWLKKLAKFEKHKKYFEKRYTGSQWIKLIKEYKEKYIKINKMIIKIDKKEIIKYMNNKNIPKKERISTFIKRFFINRFYIGIFD